jgi:demethylmenaquinone methyltransferase/2-methoxy-6-polyprenyl-1,4-benzoquinol methylase
MSKEKSVMSRNKRYAPAYVQFKSSRNTKSLEKSKFVREMFTDISPTYDRLNRFLSMRMDVLWRRRLVKESAIRAGEKVLDVCTGTGDVLFEFGRRVPGCGGTGLDFSEGMLKKARAKANPGDFVFKQGDALKLPFKAAAFDSSCMAFGLRNVTDVVQSFREMKRVTRPGRRVLALELTRPQGLLLKALYFPYLKFYLPLMGRLISGNSEAYRYLRDTIQGFFTPQQVSGFMKKAGLKDVHAIPLSGGIATLYVGTVPDPGRK